MMPEKKYGNQLKEFAYRDGPEGPYTNKRFIEVVRHVGGQSKNGVVQLRAAGLAFIELGMRPAFLLQIVWLKLKRNSTFPKGDQGDIDGRTLYDDFLEAQKGVNTKYLHVPANKGKEKVEEED
ncbi:g7801 [Coccomyxa viridis]|uniref:G7786 protein n=1 Tax=Coccomyxa viridis TaxID=1274662 RepID=A0ABP1FYQ1_9CHLO